jgi:RNA polymerase sigma-70 factor (ECF subfamily)
VDLTQLDDASLIRLIARRNSEALGILYDRYGRMVYGFALNVIGSAETSEEIVQDVFTRVWERASTYDRDLAKVSTWLVSITRNRAIDELRRSQARSEQLNVAWAEAIEISDPAQPSPEEAAAAHLQEKAVREAIAALPAEQRQALALAYFKGYSHSEIAEALDLPVGTVKTRIRLAMQKLRQVLSSTKVIDNP